MNSPIPLDLGFFLFVLWYPGFVCIHINAVFWVRCQETAVSRLWETRKCSVSRMIFSCKLSILVSHHCCPVLSMCPQTNQSLWISCSNLYLFFLFASRCSCDRSYGLVFFDNLLSLCFMGNGIKRHMATVKVFSATVFVISPTRLWNINIQDTFVVYVTRDTTM